MAQTTSAISFEAAYLGMSTDGSSFTDISGFATQVSIDGGERNSGTAYTLDGDTAVLKRGKRQPVTVTASVLYTTGASEPFRKAENAYINGTNLYLRWVAEGTSSGNPQFTTSAGIVKNPVVPMGQPETGDPIALDIVLECASYTESTSTG